MTDKKTQKIYQLNVALEESRPLIWRRVQVPSGITLPRLHRVLQTVMGWENCHLHEFRIEGKAYAEPDPGDAHFGREVADERRVPLRRVVSHVGSSFQYIYDFGDSWRHDLLLEATLPVTPRKRYPVCLGGAQSAPPEDVGGIRAYEEYLAALADPKHEEHRRLLAWRGRFDPEYFPLTGVNRQLREEFPAPVPSQKSQIQSGASPGRGFEEIFRSFHHGDQLVRDKRKLAGSEDQIPLPLSARDRELIVEYSFADTDLTTRLRLNPETGKAQVFYFTLDELNDLIGCIAAEANHADKKARPEWDVLYDRLAVLLDTYTNNDS